MTIVEKLREEKKMLQVELGLQEDALSAEDACSKLLESMSKQDPLTGGENEWVNGNPDTSCSQCVIA
eukprot:CAMPEP_0175101908 /NCGR_PEP_ID=MMETSP0086_2-20121207/8103_1 /TAXON_ID=136419 /ORGANISM="Unknown Unknown, Strain D1" /LENGTH=66 /DNA_ID=CAMNT_0016376581 /DNA_START=25 /DNA_END=225 /DNA_ORIENTATION=+